MTVVLTTSHSRVLKPAGLVDREEITKPSPEWLQNNWGTDEHLQTYGSLDTLGVVSVSIDWRPS